MRRDGEIEPGIVAGVGDVARDCIAEVDPAHPVRPAQFGRRAGDDDDVVEIIGLGQKLGAGDGQTGIGGAVERKTAHSA